MHTHMYSTHTHTHACTYLIRYVRIHLVPVHQLLDDCQLTTVTGQKIAVQIFLHIEQCDIIKGDMLSSIYVYMYNLPCP